MRRLHYKWVAIILIITASGLSAFGEEFGGVPDLALPEPLAGIIAEGLSANQELKSMAAAVDGMKAKATAAGALDDPRIGFGLMNLPVDTFSFSQEPMTQKQITLAQKFPWPGKLSLRSKSAALQAARGEALLNEKRLSLAVFIAHAYYDLGFVSRSLEINARLSDMVRNLLRVSETHYSVGKGLQQDVLQAQVELSRLLEEEIALSQKRRALENRINELLSRDAFSPIPQPEPPVLPALNLDREKLKAWGLANNPGILIRKIDIESASIDVETARKNFYPDFDVSLAYGQREEDRMGNDLTDFASASVMMTIPLWKNRKQENLLAAARNGLESKEAAYRDLETGLLYRIETLVDEITSTRENYRLFSQGLMVQAKQWAESSRSAYQVNSIEFNTMISAQMRVLRLHLQQENYLYRIYKQMASLSELIGSPVNTGEAAK